MSSDWQYEAEREMWEAIQSQDIEREQREKQREQEKRARHHRGKRRR